MKNALVLGAACSLIAGTAALATMPARVLPTEWQLSPANGTLVATGTLPQGAALSGDGRHLIVVEDGQAAAEVRIFDAATLAAERTIALPGASGAPLADAAGAGFWVSLGAKDALAHIDAATGATDRTIALPSSFWAAAIVRSPDGASLAVSGELAGAVCFVDLASGTAGAPVRVGKHPFGLAYARDGKTLFAANWGASSIDALDVASKTVRATIPVGLHPEALVLAPDGKTLYVSETDDDAIGIVDVATEKRAGSVGASPYAAGLSGASPTALALSRDGSRLFVADSAANAVVVLDVASAVPHLVGAIPTGWYPTALVAEGDGKTLDIVDGKGEGSRPNPQFKPFGNAHDESGYVAREMVGSIRRTIVPSDAGLQHGIDTVRANMPGASAQAASAPAASAPAVTAGAPRDAVVRPGGPIKHVIYVIKENRTYDQVLGDLRGADGDASLTLFGAKTTPNEHALATRFGILDNTYANAEVSADGHNWSVAAFANDYLERNWPPGYGGRRELYDFEDGAVASTPHNGYLWNAAARAQVTLRNYGEFTTESEKGRPLRVTSRMHDLDTVTDPHFPGFDLAFSDLARVAEWKREFDGYVKAKNLPQLEIVRLPNDHTAGTRPKAPTPTAYVAQNDLAVGRLVEAVSHSPYWAQSAIFIVEDDAQNGADHVDAQRMTAYVVSPFAAGGVVHRHHSTAGIVRTIETILGLAPLSAFDASAATLEDAFVRDPAQADVRPYDALPETADLNELNTKAAYRASESARLDFSREDAVPDDELNDIIRHAATPPATHATHPT